MEKVKISNEIIVSPSSTILEVIKKITLGSQRFQLVIKNNKLLGTVSDGDIRRAILKGYNSDEKVSVCMNKKPIIGYINKPNKHLELLNSYVSLVRFLPVVNKNKNVEYVLVDNNEVLEKTALIMAGGLGKRLGLKTKNTPKPLLKVKNKPILESILKKLEYFNYKKIFISTYFLHNKIENFVSKRNSKAKIEIILEKKPLGTAGCLSLMPKNIADPLTVINGDILSNINLNELASFHSKNKNDISLCIARYSTKIPFGLVTFNNNQNLMTLEEKPEINNFILSGIYCMNNSVYNILKEKKLDMTELIQKCKNEGKKIGVFPIFEEWSDIGTPKDFELANK